jgi:hypothetical protein
MKNPVSQISNLVAVMKANLRWEIMTMGKPKGTWVAEPPVMSKIILTSREWVCSRNTQTSNMKILEAVALKGRKLRVIFSPLKIRE